MKNYTFIHMFTFASEWIDGKHGKVRKNVVHLYTCIHLHPNT